MKKLKKQKGITLIALVVTIVVLLILAGITINLVLAEGGLFDRAQGASEEQKKAEVKDKVGLMLADAVIEKNVYGTSILDYLTTQKEKENLDAVNDNGDGTFTVEKDGYLITIREKDLSIIDISKTGKTAKIEFSSRTIKPGELLTATVTFGEEIDITASKWEFSTKETLGVEETNYSKSFSTNPETITLDTTTEGKYYLHILLVDKEGNKTEKVSVEILIIANPVTGITLDKTEMILGEDETDTITATVEPSDASIKEVEWSSSNEEVATVDENGVVTGVSIGSAIITVRTTDGSEIVKECEVTVVEKVYLFNNGNQNENITGGWITYYGGGTTNSGTGSIGENIELRTYGRWCGYVARPNSSIDLTDFSKIGFKFEYFAGEFNDTYGTSYGYSSTVDGIPSYGDYHEYITTIIEKPTTVFLDISDVNGEYYVFVDSANGSSCIISEVFLIPE